MSENFGFLAALGAAFCWGTYLVPFKISKSDKLVFFQSVMSVGILVSGFVISLFLNYSLTPNAYGLISGVLWAIPNALSLVAVSNLGIARAAPIMSSLVIITSFLWGTLFFSELKAGLASGIIAIGLIVIGVILVGATKNSHSLNVRKGLLTAVLAGLLWGSQFVPIKIGNVAPSDYFFSMSVGIFVTAMVLSIIKKVKFQKKAIAASLLSGTIWSIGNLLGVLAIAAIGLARGLPSTQLAVLVSVLWGLFYFKEVTKKRHKIQVLVGAIVLLLGIFLLSQS
jgi:glucose uptake protein